jgi:serine/threonine protein kinase
MRLEAAFVYPYLIPNDDSQQPPDFADRYQILSVIGQGGFGIVYKARHSLMGRTVAIKVLHEEIPDSLLMRRFQLEAQAASNLSHPNIVTVYDFGASANNQLFLVMDFLEGTDLDETLRSEGRLAVSRSLNIFIQAADALEHAHQRGVIHRDLKPSNIMLATTDGAADFVKIVDFGLAKLAAVNGERLTQTGDLLGTPLYMSPEQCLGEPLDPRSDIYALGCIMYRVLTGHLPIEGKNVLATLYQQISAVPVPFSTSAPGLDIPASVEKIVLKCLQKDPAARFQSMSELGRELRNSQANLFAGRKNKSLRREPRKLAVAAIVALGLVAALMSPAMTTHRKPSIVAKQPQPMQSASVSKAAIPPPAPRRPERTEVMKTTRRQLPTRNNPPQVIAVPAPIPHNAPGTGYVPVEQVVDAGDVSEGAVAPVKETKIGRISKVVGSLANHYLSTLDERAGAASAATNTPVGSADLDRYNVQDRSRRGKYRRMIRQLIPQTLPPDSIPSSGSEF